jgi:heme/copper-type cytochrome/quinol oxidase subunit 4
MLKRQMASGDTMKFMKTFVLGFAYKLAVILAAFWYAISILNWDIKDFVVGNLVFLITFQVYESLYFMKMQKNNDQEHSVV